MAGVFLSYDRDDVDRARPIAAALERAGHEVWWDLHVRGGAQFSKVIEEALKAADAVVVLWSKQSVESAWVKDEASAGRDSGRLIPLSLDGTPPPLGFRQFQTIDFSRWKGRGKALELQTLLVAVEGISPAKGELGLKTPISPPARLKIGLRKTWLIGAAVAILVVVLGLWLASSRLRNRAALAVVTVRPADQTAASQALARDLVVQLGALRPVLSSSMRLVDAGSGKAEEPDLVFKTAPLAEGAGVSVVLADSNNEVLWSKQFDDPNTNAADRRQQIAFTAAGVLRCALEESSGRYGRLQSDMRQTFLDACAASRDINWDTRSLIKPLRQVTEAAPNFRPGWAELLMAEESAATLPGNANATLTKQALRQDLRRARELFPDLAEATVAEYATTPDLSYLGAVALLDKAKSQDPDNPDVLMTHGILMVSVGRVADSLDDIQRAAQLDPLSPVTRGFLVRALVYAGRVDEARAELARAKQLWPGTESVRQAEGTIELRYGDFEKVLRESGDYQHPGYPLYVAARKNPTDANVMRFMDYLTKDRTDPNRLPFGVQALGEMNRVNEIYNLLATEPSELLGRWVKREAPMCFSGPGSPMRAAIPASWSSPSVSA